MFQKSKYGLAALGFVICLMLGCVPTYAEDLSIPELTGPVIDEPRLLSAAEKGALSDLLLRFHESGKVQMVVFITNSLQDRDIESFSMAAAEKWKLGKKGEDRGLLLVIAPSERKMRLEVGYGLEGELPDATSRQLLSKTLAPYFRENRFGDGLMVFSEAIAQRLGVELRAPVENRIVRSRKAPGFSVGLFVFLALLVLFMLPVFGMGGRRGLGRNRYDGWGGGGWGGGGGGGFGSGGGFSGGGGGFGGGGSSSSW